MSSINGLVAVFLLTGFTVGFGHCIGMCGPLVISYTLKIRSERSNWPHFFYNTGRVTTYSILGGIMGLTGSFTMVTSRIAGIQKGVLVFAGVLIIIMGLMMTGWLAKLPWFSSSPGFQSFLTRKFGALTQSKSVLAYYPMGLLLGLLPCGPVYTAMLASARAGMEVENIWIGIVKGAILMASFGLGTIPALVLVGKLAGLNWLKKRDLIYKTSGIIMIGVGAYFMFKGIRY